VLGFDVVAWSSGSRDVANKTHDFSFMDKNTGDGKWELRVGEEQVKFRESEMWM